MQAHCSDGRAATTKSHTEREINTRTWPTEDQVNTGERAQRHDSVEREVANNAGNTCLEMDASCDAISCCCLMSGVVKRSRASRHASIVAMLV